MKKNAKKVLSLTLSLLLFVFTLAPAYAAFPFTDKAYASILTGSDFQELGTKAYDRFGRLLQRMKDDGLETPDSMLVGGDYTKILFDYAIPGITQIRKKLVSVYPAADPDSVVCIQGNHDNTSSGFVPTGFYDMGVYCLYAINENDFPWLQGLRPGVGQKVQSVADDLKTALDGMIAAKDFRPVLVMTHLPLHHTSRTLYAENQYASYLFKVLNKAAETLDIVFLFGHQHSGDYDDYIGGSVNFLPPGETIRIPMADTTGENAYTYETLNFTYTNCGYVGYSDNTESATSTNVLTLGVVRISDKRIRIVKYTEDGLFRFDEVSRKNPGYGNWAQRTSNPSKISEKLYEIEARIAEFFLDLLGKITSVFSGLGK